MISSNDPHPRAVQSVNDVPMSYVDTGDGPPILFLHGNPTSSYIWRNIISHLTNLGRCIAPDLIGMGGSAKLENPGPHRYLYAEQRKYLFDLIDAVLPSEPLILVLHDWGGALGFDWARHNPDRVRGLAFMEPLLMPYSWETFPPPAVDAFKAMRLPDGEVMCLEQNFFVEQVIPMAIMRELDEDEMAAYRKPFVEGGEGRRATLSWPREIPIEGDPADVAETLEANCAWLQQSALPKLFVKADPGMMIVPAVADRIRGFPNITEVSVKGLHYVQEDSPDDIGTAIAAWITELP